MVGIVDEPRRRRFERKDLYPMELAYLPSQHALPKGWRPKRIP